MNISQKPHPSNVPGAFYVVDGCCTSCGVPEMARENFEFAPDGHCYVRRQLTSDSEIERVLRVVRMQELGCIRYGGTDTGILRRLAEAGESGQCDVKLQASLRPIYRNCVFFSLKAGETAEAAAVLTDLRATLLREIGTAARATEVRGRAGHASFAIAWFEDQFQAINIQEALEQSEAFLVCHYGPVSLSELIHDALCADEYEAIRWSTSRLGECSAPRLW